MKVDRRQVLKVIGGVCLGVACHKRFGELDSFIEQKMGADHIPGVVVALIKDGRLHWHRSYGWADREKQIPISEIRVQNIGSISKTFTTTALLQLWETGLFDLDDSINQYLPFEVKHPFHPRAEITFRQLLTHRSALRDGTAYAEHYLCGDPRLTLGEWVSEYLVPEGSLYDAEENFEKWAPGEQWRYCNVAYGVVAYVVERLANLPFEEYCQENIFKPLGMKNTSWYLENIDVSLHSIPYTWIEGGAPRGPSWGGLPLGVIGGSTTGETRDGYNGNCLYSHPNFPDGFLRTSVRQLSDYLCAYLNGGTQGDFSLLKESTITEHVLKEQCFVADGERIQGLTWYSEGELDGELVWGHRGNDPGINTDLRMVPSRGLGAIVFTNTNGSRPREITDYILQNAD